MGARIIFGRGPHGKARRLTTRVAGSQVADMQVDAKVGTNQKALAFTLQQTEFHKLFCKPPTSSTNSSRRRGKIFWVLSLTNASPLGVKNSGWAVKGTRAILLQPSLQAQAKLNNNAHFPSLCVFGDQFLYDGCAPNLAIR